MEGVVRHGIGVSPGIAIGPALVLERRRVPVVRLHLDDRQVAEELERLQTGAERAKVDLELLKERTSEKLGLGVAHIL